MLKSKKHNCETQIVGDMAQNILCTDFSLRDEDNLIEVQNQSLK